MLVGNSTFKGKNLELLKLKVKDRVNLDSDPHLKLSSCFKTVAGVTPGVRILFSIFSILLL